MKTLWTFVSKEKADGFIPILENHEIGYESRAKSNGSREVIISVDEADFQQARKLLLKHRERRTSGDLDNT